MLDNRVPYYLSASSFCCEVEDGAIILELVTGSYVGIDACYLPRLRVRVPNWPPAGASRPDMLGATTEMTDNLIAELLRRRILTASPDSRPDRSPQTSSANLRRISTPSSRQRASVQQLVYFLMAIARAKLDGKDKGLARKIDWLERKQSLIPRDDLSIQIQKVAESLGIFLRLRMWWYTAAKHCLLDSLVLSIYLTLQRLPCSFVIGVSTKPFYAHAWVRLGDYVLNDTAEHIQMYTAILATGADR